MSVIGVILVLIFPAFSRIRTECGEICIYKTYLDSVTSHDDLNPKITSFTLIGADHPSNSKRGGVCIYCRHSLAFWLLDIHYMDEYIIFKLSFMGRIYNFISLYRSYIYIFHIFKYVFSYLNVVRQVNCMTFLKHLLITSS